MKLNKLTWMGILMVLVGLENIFRTSPYKLGDKNACDLGGECLYIGSLWIVIGSIILIVQYNMQKKNN